jgi:tetratricopeptide (TPR) repeat protein
MRLWVLTVLTCVAWILPGKGAETEGGGDFEAANRLYDQGKYHEAATAYQDLIRSGTRAAAVYFNLGNALLKSGQLGRALAVYRTLETATPRDPDLRASLRFALSRVEGPTLKTSKAGEWLARLTVNEWTLLATAGFWAALLLLTAGQIRPTLRKPLRVYVGISVVTTIIAGVCLAALMRNLSEPKAVVIVDEVRVRQAPLEEATTLFNLRDGAELRVLDRNNEWLQVSVDPRRVGWVRSDQVLAGM